METGLLIEALAEMCQKLEKECQEKQAKLKKLYENIEFLQKQQRSGGKNHEIVFGELSPITREEEPESRSVTITDAVLEVMGDCPMSMKASEITKLVREIRKGKTTRSSVSVALRRLQDRDLVKALSGTRPLKWVLVGELR